MPLLISAALLPGQPIPAADPQLATPRIIWEAPSGDRIVFADRDGDVVLGLSRAGEDLPPIAYVEDDVVDGPGSTVRGGTASPRIFTLPAIVTRSTWETWRAIQQRLAVALWTTGPDGEPRPGRLTLEQPDGTTRTLENVYYLSGAEGRDIDNLPVYYRDWPLAFRCTDPFPRGGPLRVEWGASEGVPTFPLLPRRLGSSRLLGTRTVRLLGDMSSRGVWTISGPADGLVTLRSETLSAQTGIDQQLVLDLSGARALGGAVVDGEWVGETVTVDMRRGRTRGVRGPDGSSWWGTRVGAPTMFPLVGGDNELTVTVEGAVSGQTLVAVEYQPTYLTL